MPTTTPLSFTPSKYTGNPNPSSLKARPRNSQQTNRQRPIQTPC
jgi:hypothetical protein